MFLTRNVKDFSTPGINKRKWEREKKSMNSLNYITWNTWWNTLNLHTLAPHVFFYPDIPRHATFAVLDGRQRNTVHVNKPSCLHKKMSVYFPRGRRTASSINIPHNHSYDRLHFYLLGLLHWNSTFLPFQKDSLDPAKIRAGVQIYRGSTKLPRSVLRAFQSP